MFDNDLDILFDSFLSPTFDWDKKNYKFNREEKDMHPYSVKSDNKQTIITHNILGIDKKDLKITKETENGINYIIIAGKTKDDITGKEYSINSKFAIDESQLDLSKINATTKNGLLYIIIPTKKKELKKESKEIEIL